MNVKRGIYSISFNKNNWSGETASNWLENNNILILPVYSIMGHKYMKVIISKPPNGSKNINYYKVILPNGIKIMNWVCN